VIPAPFFLSVSGGADPFDEAGLAAFRVETFFSAFARLRRFAARCVRRSGAL